MKNPIELFVENPIKLFIYLFSNNRILISTKIFKEINEY